jgi:rhamnulokinase
MAELVAAAEQVDKPEGLLEVDDPELWAAGNMATRINKQLRGRALAQIEEHPASMPAFASLIFHSLAERYAIVLSNVEELTRKRLRRLAVVGGGSLNQFLNRLTADATGLQVCRGVAESSTAGNFAVQLATLEGAPNSPDRIAHWAVALSTSGYC